MEGLNKTETVFQGEKGCILLNQTSNSDWGGISGGACWIDCPSSNPPYLGTVLFKSFLKSISESEIRSPKNKREEKKSLPFLN
jgi:hypothetical protein